MKKVVEFIWCSANGAEWFNKTYPLPEGTDEQVVEALKPLAEAWMKETFDRVEGLEYSWRRDGLDDDTLFACSDMPHLRGKGYDDWSTCRAVDQMLDQLEGKYREML